MVLQPCRYHSRNVVVCLYMGSQDYITTIIEVQFGNNTCYYPLLCRGSFCRFTALYARQWSFSCRLSCGCNINVLVGVCPYSFQRWECYTHLSRNFTCLNVDKRHLSTGWWRPIFWGWGGCRFHMVSNISKKPRSVVNDTRKIFSLMEDVVIDTMLCLSRQNSTLSRWWRFSCPRFNWED